MKKTGESPLLQDRFGKTMYVKYGVLYNGISGNMWFEVLDSLFPLIFISHLIISVFTEKMTIDLNRLILDFPFGLFLPLELPQF